MLRAATDADCDISRAADAVLVTGCLVGRVLKPAGRHAEYFGEPVQRGGVAERGGLVSRRAMVETPTPLSRASSDWDRPLDSRMYRMMGPSITVIQIRDSRAAGPAAAATWQSSGRMSPAASSTGH